MESECDWEKILQGKFRFYDVEKSIYAQNCNKANSPDMYAKLICDNLRPGDVPPNLIQLYQEAVYGSNAKVKARIIKRVYAIGTKTRYGINIYIDFFFLFKTVNLCSLSFSLCIKGK